MRIACIYDIHGNLAALDAVLRAAHDEGFDLIACGGDLAFLGPDPAGCIDRLQSYGDRVRFVQGNTDRWLVEGRVDLTPAELGGGAPGTPAWSAAEQTLAQLEQSLLWTREQLQADHLEWLSALPTRQVLEHSVLVVHASPRGDQDLLTPETPADEIRVMLDGVEQEIVVVGHTHVQYWHLLEPWLILNPGSVGFPYDGDARAAWAMLDHGTVNLRRTAYDVDETVALLGGSDSPAADLAMRRLLESRP